jgi:ADP-heptose:LPS heptosyltransferase
MKRPLRSLILFFMDRTVRLLCLLGLIRKPSEPRAKVERVLLCNWAHLGDAVMMTALLPVVLKTWPGAKIGVLVGSWSAPLFQGHPLVDQVHCVDHWLLDRSSRSLVGKCVRYLQQRRRALREIKAADYDVAVDFYFFFHNATAFLYQTRIPLRAAYTRVGLGPLLTHPRAWEDREQSLIQYHLELLESVGALSCDARQLRPILAEPQVSVPLPEIYTVFHVGSGEEKREWPSEKWKELLAVLEAKGHRIVFTGRGPRERELIAQITSDSTQALNLCDQLSLEAFTAVMRGARLLIAVDSAAGHIASAYSVPTISLFSGTVRTSHFRPHNPRGVVCSFPMPCAPCFRLKGCSNMECIRGVRVEDVVKTVEWVL